MEKIARRMMLAASAAFAAAPALGQSATTTLVVPFPPGGSTDALARVLQAGLQPKLNRTVVVENRSGAAGALGAALVAKSPSDGSSFLVTFDSHAAMRSSVATAGETIYVPINCQKAAPASRHVVAIA